MDFNPYKVLAVDPSADPDVIAAAYRTLSKKFHPDVNKAPEAEARMRELNRAYDMLKDPAQRRQVDADLARGAGSGSTSYRSSSTGRAGQAGYGSYTPRPRTSSGSTSSRRNSGSEWPNVGDQIRKGAENFYQNFRNVVDDLKPTPPTDKTLYLLQKRLEDTTQNKTIKVQVYYDGPGNRKICNVQASAPNERGQLTGGEVYLDSGGMFDLTLAVAEAQRALQEPTKPIEMFADHDVYFRQAVRGLGKTYIGVEIIKKTRNPEKEALLLIGEKNARTERDGVVSTQSLTRLQQIDRIFKAALEAMR
jgi:curved DNA-binding protein CbpA